jgi:hypothetical protein
MCMRQFLVVVAVVVAGVSYGCSSRVLFSKNEIQEHQTVKLEMRSGESVKGEIVQIDDETLVIKDDHGKNWRAKKSEVALITGPTPVLDFENKIISEKDIAREKGTSKTWLYAVGGGGLSLGASFFAGSMISRAGDGDLRDGTIWGFTSVCTVIGTYFFSKKGTKKDRLIAIESLKAQRANGIEEDLNSERERRMKIQEEIARLKKERDQQQSELESLHKKVKSKE